MLITASLGLICNIVNLLIVSSCHLSPQTQSTTMKAALVHLAGDTVQSLGVFIAALVLVVAPDMKCVDPLTTFTFAVLVFKTT